MTLALYTTIYPGVEPFLLDWFHSVQSQTDNDFDLWIGLDALDIVAVEQALGGQPRATWVRAESGDTPADFSGASSACMT